MLDKYLKQVSLLIKCLPIIATEDCFAIKGGTAINLFCLNLPRLSVDIDLVYLPIEGRTESIENINSALDRIKSKLEKIGITVFYKGNPERKLICSDGLSEIKIEPNYTNRGFIYPTRIMELCPQAQDLFGYAEAKIISNAELWGGKICAALDRHHPRDLFDISNLFSHGGITEEIKYGFISGLLNSPRPIHELLNPNFTLTEDTISKEFSGMSDNQFSFEDSKLVFDKLVKTVIDTLNTEDRSLILDFVNLKADFSSWPITALGTLPGIKWKQMNLAKLKKENPGKFKQQVDELIKLFG